ncbi:CAMK protein kinase [Thecamonas trahens ATCC 50062]|uniref:CAMK protein kinase n=1 Tax=Thecamonas trahens ATCC 50062 TaxID=461836 RepID=A0A0L0DN00_THETB|nr:CAMK protein kinase [Thecamonas trahens ATCC 50062]KNC53406.1 CAMK protein kinase [Thecamonas trahens ATCC 50062]|eukprot:XP_013754445.1 CAMK protein kinase [Thecamonas trahens ATCC 50062]
MTEHRPWARLEVVKGEAEAVAVAGDGVEVAGGALRIFRDDEGVVFVKAASKGVKVRGKEVGEEMTALVDDGDRIKVTGTAWEDGPVEYVVELVESDDGDDDSEHGFVTADYDMGKVLGTGNFATVRLGVCRKTGRKVAIKVCDKAKFARVQHRVGALLDEVSILRALQHPHILQLYDSYETEDHLYLVLELVSGGDLFDRIVDAGKLSEATARRVLRQVLEAVAYMHDEGVVHRDIKPENILLASRKGVETKVSDFGISRMLSVENGTTMGTMCGTPQYIAPEIVARTAYDAKVDMWSLGVLLYVMLSGDYPFVDNAPLTIPEQIQRGLYSEGAKDLCRRLMQHDPAIRWSAPQALTHPWIRGAELVETPFPDADPPASASDDESGDKRRGAPRHKAVVSVMISRAIAALDDRKGSTATAIAKYIAANYDAPPTRAELKRALAAATKAGRITHSGSRYKLGG